MPRICFWFFLSWEAPAPDRAVPTKNPNKRPASEQAPMQCCPLPSRMLIYSRATQPDRLAVNRKSWRIWWRAPVSARPRTVMGLHLLGSLCWLHRPTMHRQLGPWMKWPLHQWACSQYFGCILLQAYWHMIDLGMCQNRGAYMGAPNLCFLV